MKRSKIKEQLLPIVLMLILCISTGYAFLSSTINFNGQASIKGNNFDVHFENLKVSDDSVEVGAENEAKITEGKPTEVTFKAALNAPGDKYEFTVDVVNSGTVDAMIGDLDDIVLTEKQQKVLDYSITYKDGQPVNPMDGIKANSSLPIKISVNYKIDVTAEDIQNVDETTPIAVTQAVNYIQADTRAKFIEITPPTMLNIGAQHNDSKFSELKSYYPNLSTVTLNDSINVPEGVPNWDISEAENGSVIAYVVPNVADASKYDLHIEGEGGVSAPYNSRSFFQLSKSYFNGSTFTSINGLDLLNTSNVTNMNEMFYRCSNLTSLDLSNFVTSNVITMYMMFERCSSLTSLDLSSFDTSSLTTMSSMFSGCSNLTSLDLSSFDTSQVTSMSYMFSGCSNLTSLNLSNFDTSQVTSMKYMFGSCKSLINLDFRKASFDSVTSYPDMFTSVPSSIEIIVKDDIAKSWIVDKNSTAIVKTVAEIEAETLVLSSFE